MDEGLSRAVQTIFKRLFDDGLIYRAERIINWCPRCLTALSRHRGRAHRRRRRAGLDPVRRRRRRDRGGHHPGRDDARRHRRRRAPGRRAVPAPGRHRGRAAADRPAHPDRRRRARRPGVRHRRGQGDAGARPERLRDRPAARPAEPDHHGRARRDHRARPVPGPGPVRGAARRSSPRCASRAGSSPRSGRTCTRSGTARGARRPSSRGCRCSGSSTPARWPRRPATRCATAGCAIEPAELAKRYFAWVDNMHDWCISRQLWWGHRIPVWYGPNGEIVCVGPDERAADRRGLAPGRGRAGHLVLLGAVAVLHPGLAGADPRTCAQFYPTSVLVTGYDILFFWVARMMMFGLYAMDGRPAVRRGGAARHGPRPARQEDVEVVRQRRRPAGLDRPVRRRRHPVHPGPRRQPRRRTCRSARSGARAPATSATSSGTPPASR